VLGPDVIDPVAYRVGWAAFLRGCPRYLRGDDFEQGWEESADHSGAVHADRMWDLDRRCALLSPAANMAKADYVYCIVATGTKHVKIGRSTDVRKRLATIQTHCPHEVALAGFALAGTEAGRVERILHDRFRSARGVGEWFAVSPAEVLSVLWGVSESDVMSLDYLRDEYDDYYPQTAGGDRPAPVPRLCELDERLGERPGDSADKELGATASDGEQGCHELRRHHRDGRARQPALAMRGVDGDDRQGGSDGDAGREAGGRDGMIETPPTAWDAAMDAVARIETLCRLWEALPEPPPLSVWRDLAQEIRERADRQAPSFSEPSADTVEVRITVAVDAGGKWVAIGDSEWDDATCAGFACETLSPLASVRVVKAQLPAVVEVAGTVEP